MPLSDDPGGAWRTLDRGPGPVVEEALHTLAREAKEARQKAVSERKVVFMATQRDEALDCMEGPFHIEIGGVPICDTDVKVLLGNPPHLRERGPICNHENYYDLLDEAVTLSYQTSDESLKIVRGRCPGAKHKPKEAKE